MKKWSNPKIENISIVDTNEFLPLPFDALCVVKNWSNKGANSNYICARPGKANECRYWTIHSQVSGNDKSCIYRGGYIG